MAVRNRIKGVKFSLRIDGVEYKEDIVSLTLEPEEADGGVVTFADAERGGTFDWFLRGEAVVSFDSESFWKTLWNNTGDTVDYVYAPHGNAVATATEPHFTGSFTIGGKPTVGGEANETQVFEFDLKTDQEPTLKVTA